SYPNSKRNRLHIPADESSWAQTADSTACNTSVALSGDVLPRYRKAFRAACRNKSDSLFKSCTAPRINIVSDTPPSASEWMMHNLAKSQKPVVRIFSFSCAIQSLTSASAKETS